MPPEIETGIGVDVERRYLPVDAARLRVESRDGRPRIVGYAAMFNRLSVDMGGWCERIRPGAFANALKTGDCRALVNHDPNLILGRVGSGTCVLREDDAGLHFEVDPPDSAIAQHYMRAIERGDIDGCSFAFTTRSHEWDRGESDDDPDIRTIIEIKELFDVGPVTYPAYPDTSVAIRALELRRRERDRIRGERSAALVRRRDRLRAIEARLTP